jgi:2-dehydro-3-deoxyphosphogluconate aldolase/(4S)-4-hydroxy-2-oxoglutarate aldolase
MFDDELADGLNRCGVVAVLTVDDAEDAVPLARALIAGGIEAMELTLRTPAAVDALRAIVAKVPDMLAGIGTILTPAQAAEVRAAGAAFGVAPGANPRVIEAARAAGLPFAPGVATPSEIERALELGCRILKFFPAERSGGLPYLQSIAAPYAHLALRFMPLGGINAGNMADYLRNPLILAVGGSWIAPRDSILDHDWSAITESAREASALAKRVRGSSQGAPGSPGA